MRKLSRGLLIFILVGLALWLLRGALLPLLCADPVPLVDRHFASGGAYTDRHGKILRVFNDERGDYSVYTSLASHSTELVAAVLVAEDRGFFSHPGFDLKAILRALWQNVSNRKVISGASTISQQLIRVIRPQRRNLSTKVSELLMALRLELALSKGEILEKYLNSVSMFGNVRGIHMAAAILYGKSPEMLNLAESATLAASIQAPGRLDPFTASGNARLLRRRNWVLAEMFKTGHCSETQYKNAVAAVIPNWRRRKPFNAPHFCNLAAEIAGVPVGVVKTTIDLELQNFLYSTVTAHLPRLMKSGANQIGAMIADAHSLEILAMTGSAQYGPVAAGFNNACTARRSGGSILKPFLYALAFENGHYPSFVIPDTMQTFKTPQGEYIPFNADRHSYGPVTIRSALGNSLNISAVKMLNLLGVKNFYQMLVELELLAEKPGAADFLGLGLAIGNPEVRMIDLIRAYGILVNGGSLRSVKFFTDQKQQSRSVVSPQSAYLVYDILADPSARLFTFGNPAFFKTARSIALKTGTSTDYRDCWLLAVNSRFIIGLWVGNFSGAPTRALSGATACGPVFKNIMDFLETGYEVEPMKAPDGIKKMAVCSISGQLPGPNCPAAGEDLFAENGHLPESCSFHSGGGDVHELSADYASWIRQRKKHLDIDPFRLVNELEVGDPYQIAGLVRTGVQPEIASGPIVVQPAAQSGTWDGVKIVSPHDGDCYIMSSSHENYALLRAIPAVPVAEVIWLIDGSEFIRTPPPYEAYWPLVQGVHRICAITESEAAAEIEIKVER